MASHITHQIHLSYLRQTIELAKNSPPKPTNFRVGCVIATFADTGDEGKVLSTGYTLELPGNTHAEQCALSKLIQQHNFSSESDLTSIFDGSIESPDNSILYTSLEPCAKRLSGATPCVHRIIASGIRQVVFGAKEPDTFVQDSQSCKLLTEAGISWRYLPDFESEILTVAMQGHKQHELSIDADDGIDRDIKRGVKGESEEAANALEAQKAAERGEEDQEAGITLPRREEDAHQPRNRKKRMMEAPPESEET